MSETNLKHLDMFDTDDYQNMIELHTAQLEKYEQNISYYQHSLAQDALSLKEFMDKRDHSKHVLSIAKSRLERLSAP